MLSYVSFVSAFSIGMAIDLFFATLARFNEDHLSNRNWSVPLSLSHSILPGAIFVVLWNLGSVVPNFVMGVFGSTFIGLLVYELFMEEMGRKPIFSIVDTLTHLLEQFNPSGEVERDTVKHFLFIMSVSWDIVIGVFGTIPTVESDNWNIYQMILMFVGSGLCAGTAAMVALRICSHWRDSELHDSKTLASRKMKGAFWSLAAISTFGLTSFLYIFSIEADFIYMFPVSIILIGLLFKIFQTELQSEADEYAQAVERKQE